MSIYKEQKTSKPKIETVIDDYICEEEQKDLRHFLDFLSANKLTPAWASGNSWAVKYKSKTVCYIKFIQEVPNSDTPWHWYIYHSNFTREKWFVDYDSYIVDRGVKDFVLNNIVPPACPNSKCAGWQNLTILGKTFPAVCGCWPIRLRAPSGEDLESSKKLVEAIKAFIGDRIPAGKKK